MFLFNDFTGVFKFDNKVFVKIQINVRRARYAVDFGAITRRENDALRQCALQNGEQFRQFRSREYIVFL